VVVADQQADQRKRIVVLGRLDHGLVWRGRR
jgi:hypothetical protein